MDRLRDIIRAAGMGSSFGLALFGGEEVLHWALRHPSLRWGQILQILPFYVLTGAMLGAFLAAAGIEGLACCLWLWAGYTIVLLAGHAVGALGWLGVPLALVSMLAAVTLVLYFTRELGDEYRWGALMGGWAATLFGLLLNTTRPELDLLGITMNLGVLVIGAAVAMAGAKALAHRRPRAGVWAFLLAAVFWVLTLILPSPAATDLPSAPKKATTPKEGVSVLVVLVDGLRADHVGTLGDERGLTPGLDDLASRSIVYLNAQAAAPWGMPALASILTGLAPSAHRTPVGGVLGQDKRTLSEYLAQEADYTTGMVISNPEFRPGCGLEQGTSWYRRVTGLAHEPALLATVDLLGIPILHERDWPRAERVTTRVLEFVHSRPGSRWLVIAQYSDLRTADPTEYARALTQIDTELARLRRELNKDTWMVVTGTHGNGLEHSDGQADLWQENLHVPLIVYRPYNLKPLRIERAVSTLDLLSTLLGITESGVVPRIRLDGGALEEAIGRSSPTEHVSVLSEGPKGRAIRRDQHKLIVDREGNKQLFDLRQDPGEESDLSTSLPDVVAHLSREFCPYYGVCGVELPFLSSELIPSLDDALEAREADSPSDDTPPEEPAEPR